MKNLVELSDRELNRIVESIDLRIDILIKGGSSKNLILELGSLRTKLLKSMTVEFQLYFLGGKTQ